MPIFQDVNGLAIKFFIQKDLPTEIQTDLCETITSLGGRVEAKVPRSGYILVQNGTPEEERLRLCWSSPDRPERFFLPYTYIEACKVAGMHLKQIFVDHGEPIKMHIHQSIANVNARNALAQRITHSGGDPTASIHSARVILADPNTEIFQHLVNLYQGVPDKYIESYLWVKKCIEKGAVAYTPLVYKNPGGRRPGEERTQFTEQDEQHLCNWIATKIPFKETGGRTGNRLYQQLCDLAADPGYCWVTRHTWQSWRERYKKNASRLDKMIAAIVEQKKPVQGEKGQYGYVRQPEEKIKRNRKRRVRQPQKTSEIDYDDEYIRGGSGLGSEAAAVMQATITHPPPQGGTLIPFEQQRMPGVGGGPLDPTNLRKSPAEEEMDDTDDSGEWQVRIGDEPAPAWTKRKTDELASKESPSKKLRSSESVEGPVEDSEQDAALRSDSHVIDESIRDIAKQFRFTVEEVQEYYDKCGEMVRTRVRFQKMREELSIKFNDDILSS